LVNTLLVLASATLTAFSAGDPRPFRLRGTGSLPWLLGGTLIAVMLLSVSGALTALGDTLFPGTRAPFAQEPLLLRVRLFHPLLAMVVSAWVLFMTWSLASRLGGSERRSAWCIGGLLVAQIGVGFLNVRMSAPLSLQLSHLFLADCLWI